MNGKALTPKQEAFVEEYLKDLSATQAAVRAGYSPRTAKSIGQENLTKPDIQDAIQKAMDARSQRCEIEADSVLREIARLAFSDMRKYVEWGPDGVTLKAGSQLSDDAAAAVAEVIHTKSENSETVKFKLHDKKGSLELPGKHLKLFTDMVQLSIDQQLDNMTDEELDAHARRLFGTAAAALGRTRH